MDFFSWLPIPALWVILALTIPFIAFGIHFLSTALKSAQIKLFGRMIADRNTSPGLFWALFADGVFVSGLVVFVLISVLVELFLVRA